MAIYRESTKKRSQRKGGEETVQLTVRGVPRHVDQALRRKAVAERRSLNDVAVEALGASTCSEEEAVYHDIDHLVGTWVEDPAFDEALAAQDQVDEEMWK